MQKTEKLYYQQPHLYECKAVVVDCTKVAEGGYNIVLDRTCLFPTGGGQPCDTGYIDKAIISEVTEKNDIVFHRSETKLDVGKTVTVKADVQRRADHSCQHTGEHILSGIASKLFDTKNVGFHMAEDYATLDFDKLLDAEQIAELELAANNAVRENLPVVSRIVDVKELRKLSLRKKTEGIEARSDEFRIVYIGDVDSCTCCGTHCGYTGEVGLIKINSWQKYKSGVRIWFLCAGRAFDDFCKKQRIVDSLAKRFSTKQDDVLDIVLKQSNDAAALAKTLKSKTQELVAFKSKQLIDNAIDLGDVKIVVVSEDCVDAQELKMMCDAVAKEDKTVCIAFSSTHDALIYMLASGCISVSELCKTVNLLVNGKGGGRNEFAQGKAAPMAKHQLCQSIEQLVEYLRRLYA